MSIHKVAGKYGRNQDKTDSQVCKRCLWLVCTWRIHLNSVWKSDQVNLLLQRACRPSGKSCLCKTCRNVFTFSIFLCLDKLKPWLNIDYMSRNMWTLFIHCLELWCAAVFSGLEHYVSYFCWVYRQQCTFNLGPAPEDSCFSMEELFSKTVWWENFRLVQTWGSKTINHMPLTMHSRSEVRVWSSLGTTGTLGWTSTSACIKGKACLWKIRRRTGPQHHLLWFPSTFVDSVTKHRDFRLKLKQVVKGCKLN